MRHTALLILPFIAACQPIQEDTACELATAWVADHAGQARAAAGESSGDVSVSACSGFRTRVDEHTAWIDASVRVGSGKRDNATAACELYAFDQGWDVLACAFTGRGAASRDTGF